MARSDIFSENISIQNFTKKKNISEGRTAMLNLKEIKTNSARSEFTSNIKL
jgi:hypothetical protein